MRGTMVFMLFVAGSPVVTGLPAVDGVLAVASAPFHPGVPILIKSPLKMAKSKFFCTTP